MIWTSECIALMTRLYVAEGQSASVTAKALGEGFTRNAVIGKAHRLGLRRSAEINRINIAANGRASSGHSKLSRTPRAAPRAEKRTPAEPRKPQHPVLTMAPTSDPKPWTERKAGQCAWPIEIEGEIHSCCAPVGHTSRDWQYCPDHRRLGMVKAIPMKKLARSLRAAA